jgi:hypothetical protein
MTNIFLKHCGLLGCNALKCGDNQTFQRNILPPSAGLKSKPSKKPAETDSKQTLLGGNVFLQNAGLNYTALQPRIPASSQSLWYENYKSSNVVLLAEILLQCSINDEHALTMQKKF